MVNREEARFPRARPEPEPQKRESDMRSLPRPPDDRNAEPLRHPAGSRGMQQKTGRSDLLQYTPSGIRFSTRTAACLPGSCFTSAASKKSLPPRHRCIATPSGERPGQLLTRQLLHLGGLQKVVAAEHRCIATPSGERPGRYLPNSCFTSAAPERSLPPRHRCIATLSGERPDRYLPSSCFTSAATVTPL